MGDADWVSFVLSPVERYDIHLADDGRWLDIGWRLTDGRLFNVSIPDHELPRLLAQIEHARVVLAARRNPDPS